MLQVIDFELIEPTSSTDRPLENQRKALKTMAFFISRRNALIRQQPAESAEIRENGAKLATDLATI